MYQYKGDMYFNSVLNMTYNYRCTATASMESDASSTMRPTILQRRLLPSAVPMPLGEVEWKQMETAQLTEGMCFLEMGVGKSPR